MKKLLLIIPIILLFSLNVIADYSSVNDVWKLENNALNSANTTHLTQALGSFVGAKSGIGYKSSAAGQYLHNESYPNSANIRTLNFWFNSTDLTPADNQKMFLIGKDSNSLFWMFINNNLLSAWQYDTAYDFKMTAPIVGDNAFHMITVVWGTGGAELYVDGVKGGENLSTATPDADWDSLRFPAYIDEYGCHLMTCVIDEVMTYNYRLSALDITSLYNSGAGTFYPFAAPVTTTVTLNSPSNNTYNNTRTNINFNFTLGTTTSANCSLYTNQSGSWASPTNKLTSLNNGTHLILNNFSSDGVYKWNINCVDTLGSSVFGTENRTLTLDTASPVITTSSTLYDGMFIMADPIFKAVTNLTGYINITDTNLYSINITSDLGQIYFNQSYAGSVFSYNLSLKVSNATSGKHNLTIYAADGHTANSIPDFEYRKGIFNSIIYDFNKKDIMFFENDYIEIDVDGNDGDLDTKKKKDRYSFEYSKDSEFESLIIYVRSDHEIDIVNDRYGYLGHLIIPSLNKWIDFMPESVTGNEQAKIEQISPFEVKITLSGLKKGKSITFNSIGDLNVQTINYDFYVINATQTYNSNTIDNTLNYFAIEFNVNTSFNISANLTYNGTTYTGTKTTTGTSQKFNVSLTTPELSSQANKSFNWFFTINDYTNTTVPINQTVNPILIDNCSSYSVVAYNFSVLDEDSFAAITSNFTALLSYNYTGIQRNYSGAFFNRNSIAFCINPSYANISGDFNIVYSEGLNSRNYVKTSLQIDNVTDYLNLYLSTGTTEEITIHTIDPSDNNLENIFIEVYRYNQSSNAYYQIDSEKTDTNGNAIFNLKTGDIYYKFKLYQDGVLKIDTEAFKLFTTSYEYVIGTIIETPAASWLLARDIDAFLIFTNSTLTFLYTWNDSKSVATNYCLNVTYDNRTGLSFACSTSSSGSLSYTVTNTNASYVAQGLARINGNYRVLVSSAVNLKGIWKNLDMNTGIFISIMLVLTLSLIGLSSPKIAIAMTVLSGIGLYLLGLAPLSLMSVISLSLLGIIIIAIMRERYGAP